MSDSVRPHRRQPARLPRPWDSPGKNTGVGCHFLLQCMKVKSESEVAQSCLTLSDPMACSLPGSSIHGIFQARGLEWVPLPSLLESNRPRKRSESLSCSVVSDSLQGHGLQPARLPCPGKNTGVRSHYLLQGISQPRDQTQVSCNAGRFLTCESSG